MRHPIAVAFVVAACISVALGAIVVSTYRAEEAPWALALVIVGFPFIWFLAWLVTNAISWWKDVTAGGPQGDGGAHDGK